MNVENVVAMSDTGCRVDLHGLAGLINESRYNPDTFPGMTIRLADPKCGILLFRSGKMVCAGTRSKKDAERAIHTVTVLLRRHGIDADTNPPVHIKNMVATMDFGGRIKLEQAACTIPKSMYEPEMFPALVSRLDDKCTILLFRSGKVVCAGATAPGEITHAAGNLRNVLEANKLLAC